MDVIILRFTYNIYVQTNNLVMNTQWWFRLHFCFECHGSVPTYKTHFNKQNYQYWALKNFLNLYKRPLLNFKTIVWSEKSIWSFIDPHFFEEKCIAVTVHTDRCHDHDQYIFWTQVNKKAYQNGCYLWFQLKAERPHTLRELRCKLY